MNSRGQNRWCNNVLPRHEEMEKEEILRGREEGKATPPAEQVSAGLFPGLPDG